MDNYSLGKRINTVRKEQHLTAERLSEMCNIEASSLRQIEGGRRKPSLPVFTSICNALHVSPGYLLQDALEPSTVSGIDKLVELCENATPRQRELIIAIVKTISAKAAPHTPFPNYDLSIVCPAAGPSPRASLVPPMAA